jgi:Asp-tRNA(Asn)/Glu-tRNA(Gln) amidotransferase A subunit family amidase/enoyl-CoA hydratase/carnithine racemase
LLDSEPIFWPVSVLVAAFRSGELSPVTVAEQAFERIERFDGELNSYLTLTPELALDQAREAERRYKERQLELPPLLGVPVSIKDLFDVRGAPTSLGSVVYRGRIAEEDSEPVARLRRAGAVLIGKTNTAEFGQSATTDNLLGPPCTNPWDPSLTAGGSSGGAAASVGAGLAMVALGSDGGGSIRIPAAFCGLFGFKPTLAEPVDDGSFRAMTDFVCPGPIARSVADARVFLEVLLERSMPPRSPARRRIAWCPAPEARPVDPRVRAATDRALQWLRELGHEVREVPIPIDGWLDAFGPLVLADEWRFRRQLLEHDADGLTSYARRTIEAAKHITDDSVAAAQTMKVEIKKRIAALFEHHDLIVTPTTASPPFSADRRPTKIDGQRVGALWGPFPFTAPFNVSGSPAASVPVGLQDGLPIGLQIVGPHYGENVMLDVCEQLEGVVGFPAREMERRWRLTPPAARPSRGSIGVELRDGVAILRLDRPQKRNALTRGMLTELQDALAKSVRAGASAVVVTGDESTFSSGMDLREIGNGVQDIEIDRHIAQTSASIRALPVPVIAAIEGPCLGAAVEIALACDVRILGAGARVGIPAVKLGILYRPEAIARMLGAVGRETVSRLLLLGERITAEEAVAAGLAARVVPAGNALDASLTLAQGAVGASPEALAATKGVITEALGGIPDLEAWEERRLALLSSETRASALDAARATLHVAGAGEPAS